MEKSVKCVMDKNCENQNNVLEAFVLTGADPGRKRTKQGQVNIPEILWTAFCCYSKVRSKWVAGVVWGGNFEKGDEVPPLTVEQWNNILNLDLFPSECLKFPVSELNAMFANTSPQCVLNKTEQEDSQTASPGPGGAQASSGPDGGPDPKKPIPQT